MEQSAKEIKNKYMRDYRKSHKKQVLAYWKTYRKSHKQQIKKNNERYWKKKAEAEQTNK